MKMVVAGAGAMGGRIAYQLKSIDQDVALVDGWEDNVEAIKKSGLIIDLDNNTVNMSFDIHHTSDVQGEKADVIFILVKAMRLKQTLQDIAPIMDENTKVVCLLNGLGHVETISEFVPRQNILIGVTMWTADMIGPGHIHLSGDGGIQMQNIEPSAKAFTEQLVGILNEAGLKANYSDNVMMSIWNKACVNGVLNAVCATLDCNLEQFGSIPHSHDFVEEIVKEFADVAKKVDDVELDQEKVIALIESTYDPKKQGKHYPSMHQDLIRNHRRTEVDYINGYVAEKGKALGLSIPYCELMTILIHGKEKVVHAV